MASRGATYGPLLFLARKKAVIPNNEIPAAHTVSKMRLCNRCQGISLVCYSPALDTPANTMAPVLGGPSSAATDACWPDSWDEVEDPAATAPEVGCNGPLEAWFGFEFEFELEPESGRPLATAAPAGRPVGFGRDVSVTLWVMVVVL